MLQIFTFLFLGGAEHKNKNTSHEYNFALLIALTLAASLGLQDVTASHEQAFQSTG